VEWEVGQLQCLLGLAWVSRPLLVSLSLFSEWYGAYPCYLGKLRVIDFDQVTLSSLNRHASATLAAVGTPKATSLCSHLESIAPFIKYEPIIDLWTTESAPTLLADKPDFIIDAIDNIDTKIDLLAYCHENRLRVISSMGAGCKSDPTRVQVGDIADTIEDPLSRSTRRGLRARGIASGIQVVFSSEKPSKECAKLLPLPDDEFEKGKVDELSTLPNFRVRILPVVGTMPAIFGLVCANIVLMSISGYPVPQSSFLAASKLRPRLYAEIHGTLKSKYDSFGNSMEQPNCPFSVDDVAYLVEEVFRGRSVLEPFHTTRLGLYKWRAEGKVEWRNVVVLTKAEGKKHDEQVLKTGGKVEEVYGAAVCKRVDEIWREELALRGVRLGHMYGGSE
jgi:tRNA A37 threonylcarbamoyladenosine dehydratase